MPDDLKFASVPREDFEATWRREVHPVFGRLICWILFSAGAELLAKGACLARGVDFRAAHEVPIHPPEPSDIWAQNFLQNSQHAGVVTVPHFGTLGDLVYGKRKPKEVAALIRLCSVAKASQPERQRLLAAYGFLMKSIRNRDAHAYIPNVRDQDFNLVPELFTSAFNLLVSWLDGGAKTVNERRNGAQQYIDTL
jgi:hypothetical protein